MFDPDRWQEIFSALKKNKLRTFFTAFGVFWGIFMLIIMLGSGNGLSHGVTQGMEDFATNSLFMWTQSTSVPYKGLPRGRRFNFRNDDIKALKEKVPEIQYLAPRLNGWGRDGANNVIRGDKNGAFNIFGDYPEWNKIDPVTITQGRFLNYKDIDECRKVAVIGNRVVELLFKKDENPVGQYIQIQGVFFQVVGTFKPKNLNVNMGGDKEETIFIPFTTLQRTYNFGDIVGWFSITSTENTPVSEVEAKVKNVLKSRHSIAPEDERAIGSFNLEQEFIKMKGLFRGIDILVWIVGLGTLFAGVVGISNIMLIVVKERTKEIGIQRAIGATPVIIMSQIVTESVILTTLAGYLGLVAGVGLLELVSSLLPPAGTGNQMFVNPEVDFSIAMKALAVLIVSGAIAGIIPARKAISVKPIDALRYE
jgi:putative ABC transport system permease protein